MVFNEGLVGVVENYVKKGSKLYIEGSLQTRKWTDDSGTEKYTTEVVIQGYGGRIDMLDSKSTGDSITENTGEDISKKKDSSQNKNSEGTENVKKNDSSDELDDEIPF